MNENTLYASKPQEFESEKASNSYVMSLLAIPAGMPVPLINLLATYIFYLGNRKGTLFVRWHCTQALLSQFSLMIINTVAVVWSILLITDKREIDNSFIAYIITVLIFNLAEFIATINAAVKTRRGEHMEWWFYGALTNILIKDRS